MAERPRAVTCFSVKLQRGNGLPTADSLSTDGLRCQGQNACKFWESSSVTTKKACFFSTKAVTLGSCLKRRRVPANEIRSGRFWASKPHIGQPDYALDRPMNGIERPAGPLSTQQPTDWPRVSRACRAAHGTVPAGATACQIGLPARSEPGLAMVPVLPRTRSQRKEVCQWDEHRN
jgi:hypothetical protein